METANINQVTLPHSDQLLVVESIDYNNPYDHKALHRHDYFELIMVNGGRGKQIIDFESYDIQSNEIYLIYPGQVHLMERQSSTGILLQFKKDIFEYIKPIKHYHLYLKGGLIPCNKTTFEQVYTTANFIKDIVKSPTPTKYSTQKACSYLQIVLLTIAELSESELSHNKDSHLLEEYLSLLNSNIRSHKKVSEYCGLIGCTSEKLNEACRTGLGKTALELVHEELILEIRRLLLLNEYSFKEVAYELNFDSQGNFNAFIRSKTGMTPSELQRSVLNIYK